VIAVTIAVAFARVGAGVPQCTQKFHSAASSLRQIAHVSTLRGYQLRSDIT
jgi:hypothetical protein